jgi:hypothetical protein
MKIIIKEEQLKLLVEQIGTDEFIDTIISNYPETKPIIPMITEFLKKSGCKLIKFSNFSKGYGLSLEDRVIISNMSLNKGLTFFLYVIFHELAHQYQYKKYGIEKMYEMYTGTISVREGAEFMKYVETIADDFAFRKLREIKNKFSDKIKINFNAISKVYENVPISHYETMVIMITDTLKKSNYTDPNEISEIIYNKLKNGTT